jgi:hypothetical protein
MESDELEATTESRRYQDLRNLQRDKAQPLAGYQVDIESAGWHPISLEGIGND